MDCQLFWKLHVEKLCVPIDYEIYIEVKHVFLILADLCFKYIKKA